jgi:hypothetical protein
MIAPIQGPHNQKPLKYQNELHYFLCRKKRCIQELRGIHPLTGKPPFWDRGLFRRSDEYDELILKVCMMIRHKIVAPLEKENYEANITNLRQALLKKTRAPQKQTSKEHRKTEIKTISRRQPVIPRNEFLVYHGMQDLAHRIGIDPSTMSLEAIVNQYNQIKGFVSAEQTISLIPSEELKKLTNAGYNTENIYRFIAVYHYTYWKDPHTLDPARKNHIAPEHIVNAVLHWENTGDLVDPYHS